MKNFHKTYADAHNHLYGILPVEAIKVMLSDTKKNWKDEKFCSIPDSLIQNPSKLSFSNTNTTNDYGWLDCFDVIARLIVLNLPSIIKIDDNPNSTAYHKTVKSMLAMDKTNCRGLNSAGIILSGCIALRCLLDIQNNHSNVSDMQRYMAKLQTIAKTREKISLEELFQVACLIERDKPISQTNWIFNKLQDNITDPVIHSEAQRIAVSCVTASLSASLWVPFDDCYAIRKLFRTGITNKTNYIMLTLKWLLEKEAVRGNYFSEISIGAGDLKDIYDIIQKNASKFGFKKIVTGGKDSGFLPMIIEKNNVEYGVNHNNKLYLRFLTGFVNINVVRWDSKTEDSIKDGLNKINSDAKYGCFAGIDLFGTENFVYCRDKFYQWLDNTHEFLRNIQIQSQGKRSLWLRPHVGEGAWVEDQISRMAKVDNDSLSLFRKLTSLNDFFVKHYMKAYQTNHLIINEVIEFIYRSIFTGWLPVDEVRAFYGGEIFSTPELKRISVLLQPIDKHKSAASEKIGSANLEIMIDWVNNIAPSSIEQIDKNYPQIRFGHGTHLGFDNVWSAITDLKNNNFQTVWVDLNIGSNMITAAQNIKNTVSNTKVNINLDEIGEIEKLVRISVINSRFTCGYIQTELVTRSQRIAQFIDLLKKHNIMFVLGTDGQGVESTSLFEEQINFYKLISWFYQDEAEIEFTNKTLKNNMNNYLKYAIGNLSEFLLLNKSTTQ